MKKLTKLQQKMLDDLTGRKQEATLYNRGVELFHGCGLWRTAFSLQEKGFVEILKNENEQLMVYLKEDNVC